jgi:hypothetical protein
VCVNVESIASCVQLRRSEGAKRGAPVTELRSGSARSCLITPRQAEIVLIDFQFIRNEGLTRGMELRRRIREELASRKQATAN